MVDHICNPSYLKGRVGALQFDASLGKKVSENSHPPKTKNKSWEHGPSVELACLIV
jgi:hypothetical protein